MSYFDLNNLSGTTFNTRDTIYYYSRIIFKNRYRKVVAAVIYVMLIALIISKIFFSLDP